MPVARLTGWGRYPSIDAELECPASIASLRAALLTRAPSSTIIARGLGRSYGDSSLGSHMLGTAFLDDLLAFDAEAGTLRCQAGVTLDEIIKVLVPKGWFLPVTPGTKFVTVGGAIASDVHGKNHHVDGCFSEFVDELQLMLADGQVVPCSRSENADLFHATCGGMGLTGIIVAATLRLQPIVSALIEQTTLKALNLADALRLFELHSTARYTVAWMDCLSTGRALGRSLIMLGAHANAGSLTAAPAPALSVPIDAPSILLNRFSIAAFNALYYGRAARDPTRAQIHLDRFFYPLDGLKQWNRLYGKNGFVQYQFAIPWAAGLAGVESIVRRIADSRRGSFLSVLKVFGAQNSNLLSFPFAGYTLALDFKLDGGLLPFLDELDAIVLDLGGRVYLAKDSRTSPSAFRRGYPQWERFQEIRARHGALGVFSSSQSIRLGLD